MAARKPSRAAVTMLLKAGAYRDYCTDTGQSPADFARRAGDKELAEYLAIPKCAVKGRITQGAASDPSRRHLDCLAPTALELLAPARDADAGIAAIDHGADAVYIGGPAFGARAAAGNSLDDIARLTAYAHRFNARVFLALNTLFTNEELPLARKLAFELADAGADVLILQDMGLLEGPLPDIELHASTQCDIRTPEKSSVS